MLKLMKYEFRKTWFTKAILLAITALAEIVYLIGLYGDREGLLATGVFLCYGQAFFLKSNNTRSWSCRKAQGLWHQRRSHS